MRSERDAEFWDGFSDTYNSDDQGDAPQRIVDSLMESGAVRPDDCVMEVGSGPGSFTGMRLAAALVAGWTFEREGVETRCVPTAVALASRITSAPGR